MCAVDVCVSIHDFAAVVSSVRTAKEESSGLAVRSDALQQSQGIADTIAGGGGKL